MSNKIDKILAEISAGELFDKITILEIKKEKISNKEKLVDVEKELNSLNDTVRKFIPDQNNISFQPNIRPHVHRCRHNKQTNKSRSPHLRRSAGVLLPN